jgi:beta-lactam-binding protein with PASTA domain
MLESNIIADGKIRTEKKINPAINESVKILEKMGFSLTDWTLTPKSKEAKTVLEGYLAGQAVGKGQQMDEFVAEIKKNMDNFQAALERGNKQVETDATRLEAEAEEQETPDIV